MEEINNKAYEMLGISKRVVDLALECEQELVER